VEAGQTLTLNELARRAGVGVATVYRHFPSVNALLVAVMQAQLVQLDRLLERAAAEPDPAAGLQALFLSVLELEVKHPLLVQVVASPDPTVAEHMVKLQATAEAIVKRVRKAKALRAGVSAEDVCHLLLGVHAAALHAPEPAASARKLAKIVLAGLLGSSDSACDQRLRQSGSSSIKTRSSLRG